MHAVVGEHAAFSARKPRGTERRVKAVGFSGDFFLLFVTVPELSFPELTEAPLPKGQDCRSRKGTITIGPVRRRLVEWLDFDGSNGLISTSTMYNS